MKTLVLIDAIHTLISRDRLDLALALLRKLLKQVEPELYRQVVQLSWRFSYARSQELEGQISPEEAMRQRNQLAHGLMGLTEAMYRDLPAQLSAGASDTAHALLDAIADMLRPAPEDLRLIGNAPKDEEKPPSGSTAVGMVLLLLSALAMLGGMMRAERSANAEQQTLVVALAEAHGLTNLEGNFAHLSLQADNLQYWMASTNANSRYVREDQYGPISEDFIALKAALDEARKEGREIFTRRDWFALSGISHDMSIRFATERHGAQPRSDRNGWRVVEF